jgi:hypothetical protein
VAVVSGWLMPTPAEASGAQRVGLVSEPPAAHLLDLLGSACAPAFSLTARDALSNAIGSLHGGIGALACSLRPRPPAGPASADDVVRVPAADAAGGQRRRRRAPSCGRGGARARPSRGHRRAGRLLVSARVVGGDA